MYFFIETMNNIQREINNAEIFDNICVKAQKELFDKHNLPALQCWEDGFTKGDAGDEELQTLVEKGLISYDAETDQYDFAKLDSELVTLIKAKADELSEKAE